MPDTDNPSESDTLSRRNRSPCASEDIGDTCEERIRRVVSECRRGDRSAQRQLYDAFHRQIYRLMVRMVNVEAAADLTQQVFLQAFCKIEQFAERGRFEQWLYRLALNEAYQHLRRKRRDRHSPLVYEPVDTSARQDRAFEQREVMDRALARLDPELRSMFLLREMDEYSYREIAETLEIPEGTVGSRLNRARHELKNLLISLGWEP